MAYCVKDLLNKPKDPCSSPKQPLKSVAAAGWGWRWVETDGSLAFAGQPVYQQVYQQQYLGLREGPCLRRVCIG